MNIGLQIGKDAAEFIKAMLANEPEESCLVIAALVRGSLDRHVVTDSSSDVLERLIEGAPKSVDSLPARLKCDYFISTKGLRSLPGEHVHDVSGIKCFLPPEIIEVIGDREIVLAGGALQFRPPLPPLEIDRSHAS